MLKIVRPVPEALISEAADIYEEAFGEKFSGAIWNQEDRKRFIRSLLKPDRAFAAVAGLEDGGEELFGIVGFEHDGESFTGGSSFGAMVKQLGLFKSLWAAAVFSLFDRKASPRELVLDGIAVNGKARGQGIGTKLLEKVIQFAVENHYQSIRLDVIGHNEGARRLYERVGFREVKTEHFAYLKWLIGFSSSSQMVYQLNEGDEKES